MSLDRKAGARGLRAIVEELLVDVMYELPSLKGVQRCLVDGDTIHGHAPPLLMTASGQTVELPFSYKRSA